LASPSKIKNAPVTGEIITGRSLWSVPEVHVFQPSDLECRSTINMGIVST
jgi:hypothetical protein